MKSEKPRVMVVSDNPRFFHALAKELKLRRIKFRHLSPEQASADHGGRDKLIIITARESMVFSTDTLVISFDDDEYEINDANMKKFVRMAKIILDTGKDECHDVTIGIDPGFKRTGVAQFVNGVLVDAAAMPTDKGRLESYIEEAMTLDLMSCRREGARRPTISIKIGGGEPVELKKVLDITWDLKDRGENEILVFIVDEFQTNRIIFEDSNFIKISKHAKAAINIALRDGIELAERDAEGTIKFTNKQVRQVQDQSRKLDGGKITIRRKLATKVLLGLMTLQEALHQQGGQKLA